MSADVPVPNQVRIYECASWSDFTQQVREVRGLPAGTATTKYADRVIFRGHSDPGWKLSSRLQRKFVHFTRGSDGVPTEHNALAQRGLEPYDKVCNKLIAQFKRLAQGRPGFSRTADDDEIWALGRHHGLITPLLDWTESPYVAAFFAFEEFHHRYELASSVELSSKHEKVHIWGLRLWEDLEVTGEFTVLTASPESATRQRAQSGLFTLLRSAQHIDLRAYLESRGQAHCLELYVVDGRAAVHALRDLLLMNIHSGTLFPDLDGAALQANFDSVGASMNSSLLQQTWPQQF